MRRVIFHNKYITLGYGSGGKLTWELLRNMASSYFKDIYIGDFDDAFLSIFRKKSLAFTTDSYTIKPLFFPGGDIGKLSICGTINDLVVSGARPLYILLSLIVEEGFRKKDLEKIFSSISTILEKNDLKLIGGDFKVVPKKDIDGLFINTTGIGEWILSRAPSIKDIKVKDRIIITGGIAQHGFSIYLEREKLKFRVNLESDCQALSDLLLPLWRRYRVHFMRDPTRGGLASVLNEIAWGGDFCVKIEEEKIPINKDIKALSQILGIEPLYIASEGRAVIFIDRDDAREAFKYIKKHPLGKEASIIGYVKSSPQKRVILETLAGGERVLDMPQDEPLPRIC